MLLPGSDLSPRHINPCPLPKNPGQQAGSPAIQLLLRLEWPRDLAKVSPFLSGGAKLSPRFWRPDSYPVPYTTDPLHRLSLFSREHTVFLNEIIIMENFKHVPKLKEEHKVPSPASGVKTHVHAHPPTHAHIHTGLSRSQSQTSPWITCDYSLRSV